MNSDFISQLTELLEGQGVPTTVAGLAATAIVLIGALAWVFLKNQSSLNNLAATRTTLASRAKRTISHSNQAVRLQAERDRVRTERQVSFYEEVANAERFADIKAIAEKYRQLELKDGEEYQERMSDLTKVGNEMEVEYSTIQVGKRRAK